MAQNYKYQGMELNEELGLDWYDFNARNYDAALGRWMNIDPLAQDYYSWSPYNFVYNSPLKFTDPTGMGPQGDYYDKEGNYLGSDGIDDDKVYEVEGTSQFSTRDFAEGGKYYDNTQGYNEDNGDGYSVEYVGDVVETKMTFTGEANKDNVNQADGDINIIQSVSNGKEYTKESYSAIGGPWGNGSPENGEYTVDNLTDRGPNGWYNAGMTVDGEGFSLNLNPKFDTGRTLLRIHPDGGNYVGTQGCVGLTGDVSKLKSFRSSMSSILSRQKNISMTINIKNNPNNNGRGKKVNPSIE